MKFADDKSTEKENTEMKNGRFLKANYMYVT